MSKLTYNFSTIILLMTTIFALSNGGELNIKTWMGRVAEFRVKFEEKCLAGCIVNYEFFNNIWKAFREPIENFITKVNVTKDIYPRLKDEITEGCVDKTANYCEQARVKQLVNCAMPKAKPHLSKIIQLAKNNVDAAETLYADLSPKLQSFLQDIKCDSSSST